jgi:hypothetical protein
LKLLIVAPCLSHVHPVKERGHGQRASDGGVSAAGGFPSIPAAQRTSGLLCAFFTETYLITDAYLQINAPKINVLHINRIILRAAIILLQLSKNFLKCGNCDLKLPILNKIIVLKKCFVM